jgi:formylglycine-generating enzyme required for sulfatase activity
MYRLFLIGLPALLVSLLALEDRITGREGEKVLTNSIGMKLAPIPEGKFTMGSPVTEEEREDKELPHEVSITKPFHMGVHEVTQRQFQTVMKMNRSRFNAGGGGGPDHPAENVLWPEAVDFCNRLTALPEEKKAGRRYRLPTEAEWEYCCRAGTTTPFHFGKALSSKEANFNGNFPYGGADKGPYVRKTTKVGSYKPNAWGLYDMHGNVSEWCSDFYDADYYKKSPKANPQGPDKGVMPTGYKNRTTPGEGQFYRVIRGGSWLDEARACRSAYRFRAMPHEAYQIVGFRVVCEVTGKGE